MNAQNQVKHKPRPLKLMRKYQDINGRPKASRIRHIGHKPYVWTGIAWHPFQSE